MWCVKVCMLWCGVCVVWYVFEVGIVCVVGLCFWCVCGMCVFVSVWGFCVCGVGVCGVRVC